MLLRLLQVGRYMLVIPIVGALLLTAAVVIMSAGVVVERARHLLREGEFSLKATKMMSVTVIQMIDFFLVGALGYITAVGMYNLFISTRDEQLLKRIRICGRPVRRPRCGCGFPDRRSWHAARR